MAQRTPTRSRRPVRTARDVGRERLTAALAVIVLFVVAAGALALIAPGKTATGAAAKSPWHALAGAATPAKQAAEPDPTPYFASLRGVKLRLPVPTAAITVLAFHQSSYSDTVALKPLVDLGSPAAAREAATSARARVKAGDDATIAATPDGDDATSRGLWTGSALELWRSGRYVKQDTAVDCGASPGTAVFSPVDGTVMQVRPYKLYGRVDDFEIHIKPDAWNDLDVIILHVKNPVIEPGARVVAGLTRLASVRCLSKVVSGLQLRSYTLDGGNHTHVQINRIPKPNETWVLGEDPPGFKRRN